MPEVPGGDERQKQVEADFREQSPEGPVDAESEKEDVPEHLGRHFEGGQVKEDVERRGKGDVRRDRDEGDQHQHDEEHRPVGGKQPGHPSDRESRLASELTSPHHRGKEDHEPADDEEHVQGLADRTPGEEAQGRVISKRQEATDDADMDHDDTEHGDGPVAVEYGHHGNSAGKPPLFARVDLFPGTGNHRLFLSSARPVQLDSPDLNNATSNYGTSLLHCCEYPQMLVNTEFDVRLQSAFGYHLGYLAVLVHCAE